MILGDPEEGYLSIDDAKAAVSLLPENETSEVSGEKSVLQAKLTNLAIQIGYAGKIKGFSCFDHYLACEFTLFQEWLSHY